MSLEDNIKEALAAYLRSTYGVDAVKVTTWHDETVYEGYCETCSYETVVLRVYYTNSEGKSESYRTEESFSDLIRNL